jgi:hypothetical protein
MISNMAKITSEMTVPALTARLRKLSVAERRDLAKRAKVPYNTVHKYSYSYNASPNGSLQTIRKIWSAL